MPESPPSLFSCGTDAPGWLNGTHPTVAEGIVERQICFHWAGDTCMWSRDNARVLNCGEYFIYELPDRRECRLAYCEQ